MERLSTIASKTFEDDLRSETRPSEAEAVVVQPTSIAPPAKKAPTKLAKKDGQRDYSAEREAARVNTSDRVADLAVSGRDQTLGDEYIKLAQAMILCTLPHSATKETKITRRARLGDGTTLAVTFSATADGVGLPHGADRKLLFWLLDRAIRNDSPFVPWSSAAEFSREMGLEKGGRTNKQIKERFSRIAGLVISISRKGHEPAELHCR